MPAARSRLLWVCARWLLWLIRCGHHVRVLDLDLEVKGLADGENLYRNLVARAMHDFVPDAIGITSMYNNSLQAERITRHAKECDPHVITIGGGSHFGALGRQALKRISALDYVIEGEGEQAFGQLLTALELGGPISQVPRLHYRAGGHLHANPSAGLMDLLGTAADMADHRGRHRPETVRCDCPVGLAAPDDLHRGGAWMSLLMHLLRYSAVLGAQVSCQDG